MKSVFLTAFLTWFFYRSIWGIIPLAFWGYLWYRRDKKQYIANRQQELKIQFVQCITTVGTMLRAGLSVENAFLESERDMCALYGHNSMIATELRLVRRGLHINISLEELLRDFGVRSGCEDIHDFAQVLSIARRSGGNLQNIINHTVDLICGKLETNKELQVLLSGRKLELAIMELMPFGMILYIGWSTPGYFDALYESIEGRLLMTVCLSIYTVAFCIGDRIMQQMSRELL